MRGLLAAVGVFLLAGCASVPKESVELSVTLGRDLEELHRTHRRLAVMYFDRIHSDIDRFVDEEYRPFIIRTTMEGFRLLEKLGSASQEGGLEPASGPDAFQILELYVRKLSGQIESYRAELHRNIDLQERELLLGIDDAYRRLQNANAIVTGHLASVRKVADAQAQLLERTGLQSLSQTLVEKTARLSDTVASLLEQARAGESDLDDIAAKLKEYTGEKSGTQN
jgi:hypothetical protein